MLLTRLDFVPGGKLSMFENERNVALNDARDYAYELGAYVKERVVLTQWRV